MSRIAYVFFVWLIVANLSCQERKNMKHLFYLHGMIIETQGIHAVSPEFGPYKYEDILEALNAPGYKVHSEVRTSQTDFNAFCKKISGQIDKLIEDGVPSSEISVIGASKGALMAMTIADLNTNNINYILLGANSTRVEQSFDWKLHGRVLGIYEKSDSIAGKDYSYWIARSTSAKDFQQLEIHTGLGHGFLYRPIASWLKPTLDWIKNAK